MGLQEKLEDKSQNPLVCHFFNFPTTSQWPFQDPKMEVPTIYKAYVRGYPQKIWPYMVQYLHFRILKFPLNIWLVVLTILKNMSSSMGRMTSHI